MASETFVSAQAFLDELPLNLRHLPDCLLIDIHMPGLSGMELQRRLASVGWKVPVILMTGLDESSVGDEARSIGAAALLRKPFKAELFLETLRFALEAD